MAISYENFGNYNILGILGKGSFGTVYLVESSSEKEVKYALKEIIVMGQQAEAIKKGAETEMDCYSKLSHPKIVQYIAHISDDPQKFIIVMEYCRGGTLKKFIEERTEGVPITQILSWSVDLFSAVVYLQENGIIHRDIKPANILLTENQTIKLADFGLVKIIGGDIDTYLQTVSVKGTLPYLPPECFHKNLRATRQHSKWDVWSLGCVIHEMATLVITFGECRELTEIPQYILTHEPSRLPPQYSILQPFVSKLLRKNPKDRISALDANREAERLSYQQNALEDLPAARDRYPVTAQLIQTDVIPKMGNITALTELTLLATVGDRYSRLHTDMERKCAIRNLVFVGGICELLVTVIQPGDTLLFALGGRYAIEPHAGPTFCTLNCVPLTDGIQTLVRRAGANIIVDDTYPPNSRDGNCYRAIVWWWPQKPGWDPAVYMSLLHTGGLLIYTEDGRLYQAYRKSTTWSPETVNWTAETPPIKEKSRRCTIS